MDEAEHKKRILEEIDFSGENMTYEEKHCYLSVIRCCKDISNSINKVDGESKCKLVGMKLKKQPNGIITANGPIALASENRWLDAKIILSNNSILVNMEITRMAYTGENKIYSVTDEFTLENGKLRRKSHYNYDSKEYGTIIDSEKVKGLIK